MKKQRTTFLYFSKLSGVGNLQCNDCSTVSKLHALTHGMQPQIELRNGSIAGGQTVSKHGFQCQTCGSLTTVSRMHPDKEKMYAEIDKMIIEGQYFCECGGELQYCINKEKPKNSLARRRRKGFVCKKCSKFLLTNSVDEVFKKTQIIKEKYNTKQDNIRCKCGGEFKRTEPIFCPVCMSFNVNFETKYMT